VQVVRVPLSQTHLQILAHNVPVKMPNFHDPAEIAQDGHAYMFSTILCVLAGPTEPFFDNDNEQVVAHHEWSLYVSL
jgi:hypothetical protein